MADEESYMFTYAQQSEHNGTVNVAAAPHPHLQVTGPDLFQGTQTIPKPSRLDVADAWPGTQAGIIGLVPRMSCLLLA